jgi:hypothetical protein
VDSSTPLPAVHRTSPYVLPGVRDTPAIGTPSGSGQPAGPAPSPTSRPSQSPVHQLQRLRGGGDISFTSAGSSP